MTTMLEDGDLRLRPARLPDDVALAVPWYHDPEVLHFSEGEGTKPYDAAMVTRMFQYLADRGELYIVEFLQDGAWLPIGDATLMTDSVPIVIGNAHYRSRGLGSRVLDLLITRAVALGWTRLVVGRVFVDNARSLRMFERAGFRKATLVKEDDGRDAWRLTLDLTDRLIPEEAATSD